MIIRPAVETDTTTPAIRSYNKSEIVEFIQNAVGGELSDHPHDPNAFGLMFDKGFYVSIIWFPGSYSSNRDKIYGYDGGDWDESKIRHMQTPPLRAKVFEMAILKDSEIVTGEVFGWVTPEDMIPTIRNHVPYAIRQMELPESVVPKETNQS